MTRSGRRLLDVAARWALGGAGLGILYPGRRYACHWAIEWHSTITASYATFCRATGTPEELIIDFGLNPQPFDVPTQPIPVTQRIVHPPLPIVAHFLIWTIALAPAKILYA